MRYLLFDVFTDRVFAGNPLAIFPIQGELDDALMQAVAREMNLSESVFVTRSEGPEPAAALRIFTPGRELPFAGHPTIGTAIAVVDHLKWIASDRPSFILQLRIGGVPIAIERGECTTAWLTTPAVSFGRHIAREDAAAMLSVGLADVRADLPAQLAGAGNPFLYVGLASRAAVDRATLDVAAVRAHVGWNDLGGVYVFAQTDDGAYARMFAPMVGIVEDPATGGATGPLYAYLAKHGALPHAERFVNKQGVAMGRPSLLHVRIRWNDSEPGTIEVGGNAVLVGEGTLLVPD
ncbi:MAG: PhzF family phenazine biosynthesis protein [Candidatus Eremiobacteraeota bacterium]|nr:PhzF family phenazine biosynthesis protein [Candidatus Eremiobacteraeota bacterium]